MIDSKHNINNVETINQFIAIYNNLNITANKCCIFCIWSINYLLSNNFTRLIIHHKLRGQPNMPPLHGGRTRQWSAKKC